MRILMATYLLMGLAAGASAVAEPLARIDLASRDGLALVRAEWRYSDVEIIEAQHRAPDAQGQPTGHPVRTWQIHPRAGARDYDDSAWEVLQPGALATRRGPGRLSFNWYRLRVTVPERIGAFEPAGSTMIFETSIDDYAEIWIDGELPRAAGQSGGSVVQGWNGVNRLVAARNVQPGQQVQIAVFGANGPLSDPPANFIWMRHARLEFGPPERVPLAVPPQEVNVEVVRLDPALDAVVPANPKIFKLAEGFQFTEGPVWLEDEGFLLFSDPNDNRIWAWSEESASLSLYRPDSGYQGADIALYRQPGSNGLALDAAGRLTIAEHGNRRISRLEDDGSTTVLAARHDGLRLNSPNDLVYRSDGSLYFTDPPFGLPMFDADPRKELPFSGVYRVVGDRVELLYSRLKGPNGIAFSPDERSLYVGNWDPEEKIVLRFPVAADGSVGAPQVFADLTAQLPGEEALDGLKTDYLGHLLVAAPDGLRIYAPDGRHLGTVRAPRPIHNFAWGGPDGRTLYLTARDRLYRIDLLSGSRKP